MKKTFFAFLLLSLLSVLTFSLSSCESLKSLFTKSEDEDSTDTSGDETKPGSDFKMVAVITDLSDKIAVEVIESEYTSGLHWVNVANSTEFYAKDGTKISRSDLKVGDKVEILYSGQVMMSYPPQIVAARISVK